MVFRNLREMKNTIPVEKVSNPDTSFAGVRWPALLFGPTLWASGHHRQWNCLYASDYFTPLDHIPCKVDFILWHWTKCSSACKAWGGFALARFPASSQATYLCSVPESCHTSSSTLSPLYATQESLLLSMPSVVTQISFLRDALIFISKALGNLGASTHLMRKHNQP